MLLQVMELEVIFMKFQQSLECALSQFIYKAITNTLKLLLYVEKNAS